MGKVEEAIERFQSRRVCQSSTLSVNEIPDSEPVSVVVVTRTLSPPVLAPVRTECLGHHPHAVVRNKYSPR